MNQLLQNIMGMGGMTEQVIATDLLISAKSGVRNYAFALTEVATPEVRTALREQLRAAIKTHEAVSNFMIDKGYYHPHSLAEQLQVDLTAAQTASDLAQK